MTTATPDEWEAKCEEMAEKLQQQRIDQMGVVLERNGESSGPSSMDQAILYLNVDDHEIASAANARDIDGLAVQATLLSAYHAVVGFKADFSSICDQLKTARRNFLAQMIEALDERERQDRPF